LEGQKGINVANKERDKREDRTKGEIEHVTSQQPVRYPIKYSRIDVIT